MNSFFGVLQGSYAYLLIFQIVIVTTLLLFLLWLIARRLRETGVPETGGGGGTTVVQDQTIVKLSREQAQKIEALERQVAELDQGSANLVQATEKSKASEDKVKYLEQKLLEYEILQEEISTLSVLKIENEKLKAQVIELGATPNLRGGSSPPTHATAPQKASASPLTSDASTTGLKPFEDLSDDKPASSTGALEQSEIDGLIAKIDSLSSKK